MSDISDKDSDDGYLDDVDNKVFRPPAEWEKPELGLSKKLLDFTWLSINRPTEFSEALVTFDDVVGLNNRQSTYLTGQQTLIIHLGESDCPVDFLINIVFLNMYEGETSRVSIKTKSGDTIEFTASLLSIRETRYIYDLSPKEMYEWALEKKNLAVNMFKQSSSISQRYFNEAAKGLISHKPFDAISLEQGGIAGEQLQDLLDNICASLSACLLKEKRYEDVIYVLRDLTERTFNKDEPIPPHIEKGIYRRAVAHCSLKQLDEAQTQVERLNFQRNAEINKLWKQIVQQQTEYKDKYADMVKKMFQ